MSTLVLTTTDRKLFSGLSALLRDMPQSSGGGTIMGLYKKSTLGPFDMCGLKDSTGSGADWFHGLCQNGTDFYFDDDGQVGAAAAAADTDDTTNWHFAAVDWPGGSNVIERYHWRNQTTLGGWTHSNSPANGSARAGPSAAAGRFFIGYIGDGSASTKAQAIVAVWPNTRFSDADYGTWTKTSDLYNHPLGPPEFLSELTSLTPTDIGAGGAVYDSANSVGGTLTGADPDNWTMDGRGAAVVVPMSYAYQPMESY